MKRNLCSLTMRCTRNEVGAILNVILNGEAREEVDQFKYLGSVIAALLQMVEWKQMWVKS